MYVLMSPLTQDGRSQLAEKFADIFQMAQDDYRRLMAALRDERVDMDEFTIQAEALLDQFVTLKRIRIQLKRERVEMTKGEDPT